MKNKKMTIELQIMNVEDLMEAKANAREHMDTLSNGFYYLEERLKKQRRLMTDHQRVIEPKFTPVHFDRLRDIWNMHPSSVYGRKRTIELLESHRVIIENIIVDISLGESMLISRLIRCTFITKLNIRICSILRNRDDPCYDVSEYIPSPTDDLYEYERRHLQNVINSIGEMINLRKLTFWYKREANVKYDLDYYPIGKLINLTQYNDTLTEGNIEIYKYLKQLPKLTSIKVQYGYFGDPRQDRGVYLRFDHPIEDMINLTSLEVPLGGYYSEYLEENSKFDPYNMPPSAQTPFERLTKLRKIRFSLYSYHLTEMALFFASKIRGLNEVEIYYEHSGYRDVGYLAKTCIEYKEEMYVDEDRSRHKKFVFRREEELMRRFPNLGVIRLVLQQPVYNAYSDSD